jgi:hypothetical protein
MYAHLLEVALRERSQPATGMTTGQALATLFDCRQHLDSIASSERGMDWSSTALANQVAYDIALIGLARCVGLDCDPTSFDQPQRRRIDLEHQLISRGIRLNVRDHDVNATSERR